MGTPPEQLSAAGRRVEPIDLPISRGPATGYTWTLDLPAGVRQLEDGPPAGDQSLGGAGGGALRVAAEPGTHHLVARLARAWDPDHPARVVEIVVTVE